MGDLPYALIFVAAVGVTLLIIVRARPEILPTKERTQDSRWSSAELVVLSLPLLAYAVIKTVSTVNDQDWGELPLAMVSAAAALWLLWRARHVTHGK